MKKHILWILVLSSFPILVGGIMRQKEINQATTKQIWEIQCDSGWVRYESVERFPIEQEIKMCSIE